MRDPAEYAQGHLKGFRHAAGGQLVQATDQYVGARHATIVLHDNDGVRATMTAHWLMQMNWSEVYILDHKPAASELTTEAEPRFPKGFTLPTPPTVAPAELNKSLEHALVIDLDTSLRYRDGHVPGAWFAVRAGLGKTIPEMLAKQKGRDTHRAGFARRRDRRSCRGRSGRRPRAACRSWFWQAA